MLKINGNIEEKMESRTGPRQLDPIVLQKQNHKTCKIKHKLSDFIVPKKATIYSTAYGTTHYGFHLSRKLVRLAMYCNRNLIAYFTNHIHDTFTCDRYYNLRDFCSDTLAFHVFGT